MGSAEKKRRREANRALAGYSFVFNGQRRPLKASRAASDMLLEYASPLVEPVRSWMLAVAIAVFSWNVTLMEPPNRPKLIDEFVSSLFGGSPGLQTRVRTYVAHMIERKLRLYPDEPIYFAVDALSAPPAEGEAPSSVAEGS